MEGVAREKEIEAQLRGPGSGRYALPTTCGYEKHDFTRQMQPAISFGRRLHFKAKMPGPGPAYFIEPRVTRYGKDGTPSYSILGRQKDPKGFLAPAPGAYHPEKVHPQGERHAPAYSMGSRTRFRQRDTHPAPSSYTLPVILGPTQITKKSYPSYTMKGRPHKGSFCEDLAKAPGPGQYNSLKPNIVRNKAPEYSMLGNSKLPGDKVLKPGPGAHRPEQVFLNKPVAPKFSLGIRHSEFVCPLILNVDTKEYN